MADARPEPFPRERRRQDLAAMWRTIADRLPVAVAVTTGASHVLRDVNAAFCRMHRAEPSAALGHPFVEAFPEAREDGRLANLDRVFRTGVALTAEDRMRGGEEAHTRYWSYEITALLDEANDPDGLVLLIWDTTQRVANERALAAKADQLTQINERVLLAGLREQALGDAAQREATRLRTLLDHLATGVCITDGAGVASLVNDAANEVLGFSLQPGDRFDRLDGLELHGPDGEAISGDQWPLASVLRGESTKTLAVSLARPDGAHRDLLVTATAIRDDHGSVDSAITLLQDVTQLRELERAREEYVALISHDLRAPLTVVTMRSELLARRLAAHEDPGLSASAQQVRDSAVRMTRMVEEVLESAQLQSRTVQLHREPTDLARLVREVCDRVVSPDQRARLRFDLDEGTRLHVDRSRLGRAFSNLVTNALKYADDATPVTVWLKAQPAEIAMRVNDEGPGIPAEELDLVFSRYYRAKGTRAIEGTGLGLYITRLIVEAHGGRIWAQPGLSGRGTCFSLVLPGARE
jgi:signal transduction histidine kinase